MVVRVVGEGQSRGATVRFGMSRFFRIAAVCVSGGIVFQTTSCSPNAQSIAADAVAGLVTSIVNVFITSLVSQLFGTGGTTGF